MKKKIFIILAIITAISGSSTSVYAAPQYMEDGGIFDADWYKEQNPDVVEGWGLGTTAEALYQHYLQYGRYENRMPYNINMIESVLLYQSQNNDWLIKRNNYEMPETTLSPEQVDECRHRSDPKAPKTELGNIEVLSWDADGCGIHYKMTFTVSTSVIRNIEIGDRVVTVNNESPILEDRWARIIVDDGRIYTPDYDDFYKKWSEARKAISRGVSTAGAFKQNIPDGIMAGQIVTIEVYQHVTSLEDKLEPQILVTDIENPGVGYPRGLVYGPVVFDDGLGKELYMDMPFFPGN